MLCRPIRWVFLQLHLCLAILALVGCAAFAQDTTVNQQQPSPQQQGSQTPAQSSQPADPAEITQVPARSVQPPSQKDVPELTTEDVDTTFRVRVNLVEVRVVVRDAKGQPVKGLKKEDFQLLDDGKPQVIKQFAVQDSNVQSSIRRDIDIVQSAENPAPQTKPATSSTAVVPQRYVAYVFDDMHLPFDAIVRARTAALAHLQQLSPKDRAAIYTTSGQSQLDFTDDRSALQNALNRITPRLATKTLTTECPHMTYYMADSIVNRGDQRALDAATFEVFDCAFQGRTGNAAYGSAAESMVRSAAQRVLHDGDSQGRIALDALRRIVQRLAIMPGTRTIVLVSPSQVRSTSKSTIPCYWPPTLPN